MYTVIPDHPKFQELFCGDIIHFPVDETNTRRYLVREIVNETEKIKFSADPPKPEKLEDNSIRNYSCIYHNSEMTTKVDHACFWCGESHNDKSDYLHYLCKNCEDQPIHNKCLNKFIKENLFLDERENVIYFELSGMVCNKCGKEYPKTFKYKEKKVQLLRVENDPNCPYIILENLEDQEIMLNDSGVSNHKELGVIRGMIIKFETTSAIRIGLGKNSYAEEEV